MEILVKFDSRHYTDEVILDTDGNIRFPVSLSSGSMLSDTVHTSYM